MPFDLTAKPGGKAAHDTALAGASPQRLEKFRQFMSFSLAVIAILSLAALCGCSANNAALNHEMNASYHTSFPLTASPDQALASF